MLTVFTRSGDGKALVSADAEQLAVAFTIPPPSSGLISPLLQKRFRPSQRPIRLSSARYRGRYPRGPKAKVGKLCHGGGQFEARLFFSRHPRPRPRPRSKSPFQTTELDIFLSERYLVTLHEQPLVSVHEMEARVQNSPETSLNGGIDILLYELLDRLVDKYAPILDDFQETLDKLEELAVEDPPPEF